MSEDWFLFSLLQVENPALTELLQAVVNTENIFLY